MMLQLRLFAIFWLYLQENRTGIIICMLALYYPLPLFISFSILPLLLSDLYWVAWRYTDAWCTMDWYLSLIKIWNILFNNYCFTPFVWSRSKLLLVNLKFMQHAYPCCWNSHGWRIISEILEGICQRDYIIEGFVKLFFHNKLAVFWRSIN